MTCDKKLTLRQRQVVALVSQGVEQKDIAAALGISEATIHNHVGRILNRLGALNSTHAAAMVARCELGRRR
jgi:DNA-binding NarL/FixJ family response regulator